MSTVSRQFTLFERGNIAILKELGYEIHCAANYSDATDALNELDIVRHHIDIQRSPFSTKQIKAFFQLKKIMKDEKFDLVHCHAPMGGVLGRICAKSTNTSPVLYTAHGFHFYKGAPFINNLIYKAIEKIMARYTDVLITMNNEDYDAANKFKLRSNGKVIKIPGVGVDTEVIKSIVVDKEKKRKEIGVPNEAFLMLSVGELIPRKNHIQVINTLAKLVNDDNKTNIYYAICGRGVLLEQLKEESKNLNVDNYVKFLGYRTDVYSVMKSSDLFIFPSLQEGLPKSIMEAMASGLPVVASNIRGNIDLINNGENGYVYNINSKEELIDNIYKIYNNTEILKNMSSKNTQLIKEYDIFKVNQVMRNIYMGVDKNEKNTPSIN